MWTQEQRDKACIFVFTAAGMPKSAKHLSDAAIEVAIEIACQRNELLAFITKQRAEVVCVCRLNKTVAPFGAGIDCTACEMDALIAKAEGK